MMDKKTINIIVDGTNVPVDNFGNFAGKEKFFAYGLNGHLYYKSINWETKKEYSLLKKNIRMYDCKTK